MPRLTYNQHGGCSFGVDYNAGNLRVNGVFCSNQTDRTQRGEVQLATGALLAKDYPPLSNTLDAVPRNAGVAVAPDEEGFLGVTGVLWYRLTEL